MRQPWPEDCSLDDLLCEHFHPDEPFVPAGGFGDLRFLEDESSRLAVFAITGRTVDEHEADMVEKLRRLGNFEFAIEPPPAG